MATRRDLGIWLAAVLLLAGPAAARAGLALRPDRQVPASLYKLLQFTDWPAQSLPDGAPLVLCINPDSAFGAPVAALNDRMVRGHRVVVQPLTAVAQARACHMLYVDPADRKHWAALKAALHSLPVLTVAADGDTGGAAPMVVLHPQQDGAGFDIDLAAAARARLSFSSKLLRLARVVAR